MKLPNGYGSVYKKSGKRRRPYVAVATIGWSETGKQIRKIVGYTTTSTLGLRLLASYHENPYDLQYRNLRFKDLWIDVIRDLELQVDEGKMTESNLKCLTNAFINHCQTLHDCKILELKRKQIKNVIESSKLGYTGKGFIRTVCKKIIDCAIDEYELPIKVNPADKIVIEGKKVSDKHIPYTDEELAILWANIDNNLVKIILINAYCGSRPNEIFITEKENIHIDENYFITGSKTDAGKNRTIPIHPKIKHLIKYFYDQDNKFPFTTVFPNFNYSKFSREYRKLMKDLNLNHTPYDARHTFITKMKQARADEYILKRIVGHSISDITESVYTHRNLKELLNEIKKID